VIVFIEILAVVSLIVYFADTPTGRKFTKILPTPFWIYFIPIVLGTVGLLPNQSPAYGFLGLHALPAALILMLIGTPVTKLLKLGPKALLAMGLGSATMFFGAILAYLFLFSLDAGGKLQGCRNINWNVDGGKCQHGECQRSGGPLG